jgi:nitrite reductase/ring-hydroxylating ferredoxin subunit
LIGEKPMCETEHLRGKIEEVKTFERQLSDLEVKALGALVYNHGGSVLAVPDICPYCEAENAGWHFDVRVFEGGRTEGELLCAACEVDLFEKLSIDPARYVSDEVYDEYA